MTFKAGQAVPALDVVVELAVDVQPINPFDFFVDDRVRSMPFAYPDRLDGELAPYLDTGDPAYRLGRAGMELLRDLPAKGDTIVIHASGMHSETALQQLVELVEGRFGED